MIKVVITGGAGFIGSNLAAALLERGCDVTVIDNLSTGKRENINGTKLLIGDVRDIEALREAFNGASCVYHLAAISNVPQSVREPLETHEINVTGTVNVLVAARACGIKRVVFASSAAVYGSRVAKALKEDMQSNPLSPYAASKLAGENYCHTFNYVYDMACVVLRLFNVYGPCQNYKSQYLSVLPSIINRIDKGLPPVIYGDGEQTRDFVYVKDVVNACMMAGSINTTGIFNIGSGRCISINDLTKMIIKLRELDISPVYEDARTGDVRHSMADISHAVLLRYYPRYTFIKGLQDYL